MTRQVRRLGIGFICAVVTAAASASAQSQATPAEPAASADDQVEAYLDRLGLQRLTAEQIALRLASAAKEQRVPLAERLGKLYVQLLTHAATAEDSRLWEQRGRDLLRDVPEADTSELRLNLNKAVYLRIEEIVERGRLRLAEPAELQEADRQLRALIEQFTEIASRSNRRVETLERIESSGDATEALVTELSDARRIRSLAYYFAGWCNYYVGYLSGSEQFGQEALRSFGWLLNSPAGRPATIDRLPRELLRYEHIARAAMGCGLASGIRDNDADAVRWLDEVGSFPDLPASVRDQLLIRRLIVLGDAKRWADIERLVRQTRRADATAAGASRAPNTPDSQSLAVGPARLLAVIALEADRRIAGPQIEALARTALGDLVARQEIGQVLDLVRRYGTDALGDSGFIVHYVRGLIQYDEARKAHRAAAHDVAAETDAADEPTANPEVRNLYDAAAAMLGAAKLQPDAASFRTDLAKASVMLGRCRYYSGSLSDAGERFLEAWDVGGRLEGGETTQEALWLAVLAFDRASRAGGDGAADAEKKRTEAAVLFLASYPDSPRAARIVLMQSAGTGGDVADDDAIRILSEVPRESPVYEPARRQVARLLYNNFRSSRGATRDAAAMRFIAIAEELLASDRSAAMGADPKLAAPACDRLVIRARQMLDVLLGGTSPDAARAAAVLDVLDGVAIFNKLDLSAHQAELTFRRIQIALANGQDDAAAELASRLPSMPGGNAEFTAAADRLIYKRFASAWKLEAGNPSDATVAGLIRFGRRVIERLGPDSGTLQDPAIQALYSTVAAAATRRAQSGDTEARDLAIALDESLLKAQPRSEEALRRLAANAEAAGRVPVALECWRVIFSAAEQASPAWFEARFESLRLLAAVEPVKARELLEQHRLLYPEFGPEPWGDKLRGLDTSIPAPATPAEPRPADGGGSP